MRSKDVLRLRQGHANLAKSQGYRRKSAMPWSEEDVRITLEHLQGIADGSDGMARGLALRDGVMLSLLWETQCRGANAGAWRLENLRLPSGRSLRLARKATRP